MLKITKTFKWNRLIILKKVFNKLRGFPCARRVGGVRGTWVLLSVCPAAPIKGRIIANGKLQCLQSLHKKEKVSI